VELNSVVALLKSATCSKGQRVSTDKSVMVTLIALCLVSLAVTLYVMKSRALDSAERPLAAIPGQSAAATQKH
jgi:uncharacterized membrane protein